MGGERGGGPADSGARGAGLLRWQWSGYARYHRSRFNLLLHLALVPLFLLGNLGLVVAVAQGAWLAAGLATIATVVSIGLQGAGHRREPVPPEPFAGPLDAVARIFAEQWVTFPRYVVSGAWLDAWRTAAVPRDRPQGRAQSQGE